MDFTKDYYQILSVTKTSTREEIKASYRRLAKQYHPDRNPNDPEAEGRIKDINEAYEILYNDITRNTYNEFRQEQEARTRQNEMSKKERSSDDISETNKRTYARVHVIHKEKRTYLKGKITAKFWGELIDRNIQVFEKETDYRIHPTDVVVEILESDIHPPETSFDDYQKQYRESDLFTTPLRQPVNCIVKTDNGDEYYALELKDIRVKNPTITNVTKHEGESLGTLTGDLYAFVNKIITDERTVLETECFGETGQVEFREHEGHLFMRKEIFNPDCTRSWEPWLLIKSTRTKGDCKPPDVSTAKQEWKPRDATYTRKATYASRAQASGCLPVTWLVPIIAISIINPAFGAAVASLAVIIGILYLFNFLASSFRFFLPLVSALFIGAIAFSLFRKMPTATRSIRSDKSIDSFSSANQTVVDNRRETSYDSDSTTSQPRKQDTLISHFVRWRSYDSTIYETNLSVFASDLRTSQALHSRLSETSINTLPQVHQSLAEEDDSKLRNVYSAFDSIRRVNNLNDFDFAQVVVSCIQSLPYYLVLDQDCNPSRYRDDDFISSYLAACNRDCCLGNVSFGIASPVEFMSHLKGDCDTRSLMLYAVLKHFGYNVALLISEYYKHAVIAVNFTNQQPTGLAMNIDNRNYYLWETTSAGLPPGAIPPAMQNLNYWNISLLNKTY